MYAIDEVTALGMSRAHMGTYLSSVFLECNGDFTCPIIGCSSTYGNFFSMARHVFDEHTTIAPDAYLCAICNSVEFKNIYDCLTHAIACCDAICTVKQNSIYTFQCRLCPASYSFGSDQDFFYHAIENHDFVQSIYCLPHELLDIALGSWKQGGDISGNMLYGLFFNRDCVQERIDLLKYH